MPPVVMTLLSVTGRALLAMLTELVTARFIRKTIRHFIGKLVKSTKNKDDDKVWELAEKELDSESEE